MSDTCEIPVFKPDDEQIKKILKKYHTIAIVGISQDEEKPSFRVASYLKDQDYKIIPVNPRYKEILGEQCHSSLKEIPESVEIVDVFRKPEAIDEIAEEAIEIGAKVIWMQLGIVNNKAAQRAKDAGLEVVMDRCMYIEHKRLFS
jgi:predicted CoA-binding protein